MRPVTSLVAAPRPFRRAGWTIRPANSVSAMGAIDRGLKSRDPAAGIVRDIPGGDTQLGDGPTGAKGGDGDKRQHAESSVCSLPHCASPSWNQRTRFGWMRESPLPRALYHGSPKQTGFGGPERLFGDSSLDRGRATGGWRFYGAATGGPAYGIEDLKKVEKHP